MDINSFTSFFKLWFFILRIILCFLIFQKLIYCLSLLTKHIYDGWFILLNWRLWTSSTLLFLYFQRFVGLTLFCKICFNKTIFKHFYVVLWVDLCTVSCWTWKRYIKQFIFILSHLIYYFIIQEKFKLNNVIKL